MSVPDTRTAFNCCCSFNWKSRTNGNLELSIITLALDTRELLSPHSGRVIPGEEGIYILTTTNCGPESQFGNFGEERKFSISNEFEPWDCPQQRLLRKTTAQLFQEILICEV
jgi:isocitrate lyase